MNSENILHLSHLLNTCNLRKALEYTSDKMVQLAVFSRENVYPIHNAHTQIYFQSSRARDVSSTEPLQDEM